MVLPHIHTDSYLTSCTTMIAEQSQVAGICPVIEPRFDSVGIPARSFCVILTIHVGGKTETTCYGLITGRVVNGALRAIYGAILAMPERRLPWQYCRIIALEAEPKIVDLFARTMKTFGV